MSINLDLIQGVEGISMSGAGSLKIENSQDKAVIGTFYLVTNVTHYAGSK